MKIIEVKRDDQRIQVIDFLRREGALNLYLYEGLASNRPGSGNYLLHSFRGISGAAHTRSGTHFHIFLSERIPERAEELVGDFFLKSFPRFSSFFGDSRCVKRLAALDRMGNVKINPFLFMELAREDFRPGGAVTDCLPVRGGTEHAEQLLPLQIQYEVEEIGVNRSSIDREKTLMSLKRRLSRGEVTVLFRGGRPLACAGVNARFEGTCQLGSIYVVPELRGKGLGSEVVSAHVERMFERYGRVVLFVGEKNSAARRVYEKLGFRTTGGLAHAKRVTL